MARVKRFIYNSDFMTLAKVGHAECNVVIPAKKSLMYAGWVYVPMDIPDKCFARYQVKYQGTSGPLQWLAVDSDINIETYQNGRRISYTMFILSEEDKIGFYYYVVDMSGQQESILINSQTLTFVIDFLRQPNT